MTAATMARRAAGSGTGGPPTGVLEAMWRASDYAGGVVPDASGQGRDLAVSGARFHAFDGVSALFLPGGAGNYVSAPNGATYFTVATATVRAAFDLDNLASGSEQTLLAWWQPVGNKRSFRFYLTPTGELGFDFSTTGANVVSTTTNVPLVAPPTGDHLLVRADHTVTPTPVPHAEVQFYVKTVAAGAESTIAAEVANGSNWINLGPPIPQVTTGNRFMPTLTPVTIGADGDGANRAVGLFRAARNGHFGASASDIAEPALTFPLNSDIAGTATINRSASGPKCALVDRPLLTFNGTTDVASSPDIAAFEFAPGEDFTFVVAVRRYGTPPAPQALLAKRPTSVPSAVAGVAVRVNSAPYEVGAVVADGVVSDAVVVVAPSDGVASLISLVRGGGNVQLYMTTLNVTFIAASAGATANASPVTIEAAGGAEFGDSEWIAAAIYRAALTSTDLIGVAAALGVAG